MNTKFHVILLLLSLSIYSQDVVKLKTGIEFNLKIQSNTPESISFEYSKTGYPAYIAKEDIDEIRFENGTVEKIIHPVKTLQENKDTVIRLVNENAMAEKSGRNFVSSFEGDYLRMIVLSGRDNSELNDGLLFDFSKVYEFHENSLRENNRAYINIWLDRIRWPKRKGKDRMDKIKLVIRVDSYEKAELLLSAFKQLNKALNKI